jgi:hypothetical protein
MPPTHHVKAFVLCIYYLAQNSCVNAIKDPKEHIDVDCPSYFSTTVVWETVWASCPNTVSNNIMMTQPACGCDSATKGVQEVSEPRALSFNDRVNEDV